MKKFIVIVLYVLAASSTSAQNLTDISSDLKEVDLGLSVNWAGWNIGANSPEQAGDFYAWGELSTKDAYTYDNSLYHGEEVGYIGGNPKYDIASKRWGDGWRMPNLDEVMELNEKCKFQWGVYKGMPGMKVTGPNKQSIFLPAGGCKADDGSGRSKLLEYKSSGTYRTATPNEGSLYDTWSFDVSKSMLSAREFADNRYDGELIRAVHARTNGAEKKSEIEIYNDQVAKRAQEEWEKNNQRTKQKSNNGYSNNAQNDLKILDILDQIDDQINEEKQITSKKLSEYYTAYSKHGATMPAFSYRTDALKSIQIVKNLCEKALNYINQIKTIDQEPLRGHFQLQLEASEKLYMETYNLGMDDRMKLH